jgi:hypothetical protein
MGACSTTSLTRPGATSPRSRACLSQANAASLSLQSILSAQKVRNILPAELCWVWIVLDFDAHETPRGSSTGDVNAFFGVERLPEKVHMVPLKWVDDSVNAGATRPIRENTWQPAPPVIERKMSSRGRLYCPSPPPCKTGVGAQRTIAPTKVLGCAIQFCDLLLAAPRQNASELCNFPLPWNVKP